MPALGADRSYENKFAFRVEIDGVTHAGFVDCSEFKRVMGDVEIREGGSLTAQKTPGLMNFEDITLQRGAVTEDSDLYDWAEQCADAATGFGEVDFDYMRTVDIVVLDRDDSVKRRLRLYQCYVKEHGWDGWDNNADEKTLERLVLRYRYGKWVSP